MSASQLTKSIIMNQFIFQDVVSSEPLSLSSLSLEPSKEAHEPKDSTKTMIVQVEDLPKPVGFADLPREIRDYIYGMIFILESPVYPSKERAGVSEYLGLLRSCRLVYTESIEFLYGRNTFQIRGNPAWKSPEFLNLLITQRRDSYAYFRNTNTVCMARFALKRLYIPSHNISLDRLKHLFSLLKHFPNLDYLRVVYLVFVGMKDMDVVNVCRLFLDRRPLFKNFVLCKRISYKEAEDISWIIHETPYRIWTPLPHENGTPSRHMWKNQDGLTREAPVVTAPQTIPE